MKYFSIGNRIGTLFNITTNNRDTYVNGKRFKIYKDIAFEIWDKEAEKKTQ